MILGGILPLLVPLILIVKGHIFKKENTKILGWLVAEAVLIGSIISSFYKAFTGRIQPDLYNISTNISGNFEFGFLRHGIFWGWPSSHTTVAFAMAFIFIGMFPKNKTIKYISFFYALYIGIGVSLSIHWLSECIAGAIIGSIIGITIIQSYRKRDLDKKLF
ncbi:MAG: phosphatase PAP2 family protein [bacterium]